MAGILKKFFGTAQSRKLNKYRKTLQLINQWEQKFQSLSSEQLIAKTEEFKQRFQQGETVEDLLPEAYAVVKNTCRRLCGKEFHVSGYEQKWDMIPYDVQLLGAIAMHYGCIAQMHTGEGKTLTAAMPLYLNALTGKSVHLVTVNDYLAKRDCEWIGEIFRFHGLTVAALTNDIQNEDRHAIYKADIVYGTASEFGFDYLRDNSMAHTKEEQVQRDHYFAIIDEVDSILIDEARTPLIISGPTPNSKQMYDVLKNPVAQIVRMQRDLCTKLASEAKRTLSKLQLLDEEVTEQSKLTKEEQAQKEEAFKTLWVVSKGTPRNRTLKRLREHPDIRAELEQWETFFYAEANKEEKSERLAELFITVDERLSEFELTDKGIELWSKKGGSEEDFVMLDLGHEYAKIDQDTTLSEDEKISKKVEIREEDSLRKEKAHNLRQLFRGHLLMENDVDYIVQEGKIVIIDENTGRPQPGRRFSDGLHQAIEAKENVKIQQETQTYATITLQNYFRMYDKLAGMTGTASTEAAEFKEIYTLEVLEIPTHKPCIRKDSDDLIYMSEREKYQAILAEVKQIHEQGRPILIGTESVDVSQKLSRIFRQNKLPHTVLNAKNHEKEAEIIAQAGEEGAITIATNMAGRGTDIKLAKGVAEKGGLHVIGSTRHHSRRIDRQLRGRCARQGDPGSSVFFVSFEDELMRLFASPKLTTLLQRFRPPEGEPISAKMLNKSIETAQKRIEQRNYAIRKHTLEYDDVMNKQRKEVYSFRNDVLHNPNPIQISEEILHAICEEITPQYFHSRAEEGAWDREGYRTFLMEHFPVSFSEESFENEYLTLEDLISLSSKKILHAFHQKLDHQAHLVIAIQRAAGKHPDPVPVLNDVVRSLLLRTIDRHWQLHLLAIDHLRSDVNLRVIGQKDPLMEFKHEAFHLFEELSRDIRLEISHGLFKFEMMPPKSNQLTKILNQLKKEKMPSYFSHSPA